MKSLRNPLFFLIGIVAFYLFGYVMYYHTNLGINPTTPLGVRSASFFPHVRIPITA